MRDGQTRTMPAAGSAIADWFLSQNCARIVIVAGGAVGEEFEISSERVVLGRGPGVDLSFDDSAMSRQHAALQIGQDGFEIRDLDSTNGVLLNGTSASAPAPLKHGDRFQLGDHVFQYLLEEREQEPRAFEIPES